MRLFQRPMRRLDPLRNEESLRIIEDYIKYMQQSGEAMTTALNKRFDIIEERIRKLEEEGSTNGNP